MRWRSSGHDRGRCFVMVMMMVMMVMMMVMMVMMVGGYGSEWCMRRKEEWKRQRDVGGIYAH